MLRGDEQRGTTSSPPGPPVGGRRLCATAVHHRFETQLRPDCARVPLCGQPRPGQHETAVCAHSTSGGEEVVVSRFTEKMFRSARDSTKGMVTGEPHEPVRYTWAEVHERARRVAGGLAAAGVGHGDSIGVLAGFPVEIAPTAQGLWMRGASLTMLHQPTPRTDLAVWAEDTATVIDMIEAKAVIVAEPFMAAVPVLEDKGVTVLTIEKLLACEPTDPVDTGEDDLALMQLTSGSTGSPKAVQITHRNVYSNIEAMFVGVKYDMETDVMISWLPCFHDMGMIGFLTVPMYFGAELVKVTPLDFLRDTLLWAKLIDKYKGTFICGPNFAYSLFAKRLRNQAKPGQFDLSTLRIAMFGAEPVEPADVEDLIDVGQSFGLNPNVILPAYGMAETTLAVAFSPVEEGMFVDEVDADLLAALRRSVPSTRGNTKRLASLGPPLSDIEVRIIDEDGSELPARSVGVIQLRGEPVTPGYLTMAGFIPAQDEHGWYDTGDVGYQMENGHIVVCGRVKDVIIMAGRNIYPTDIERAAGRVDGVRPGCAVAVRLDAGRSRESFAVAVECNTFDDPAEVRRLEHQVAHEVVTEVDVRPRNVVVLGPGSIPKTSSGKLRRANSVSLVS
jgi:fatty-acyl-CoA synthase